MSKFKVGDPVTFKDEHRHLSWYISDVLYVAHIFAPGEYGSQFTHELIKLIHPYKNIESVSIVVHESKIELNLSASRELKLNELGI